MRLLHVRHVPLYKGIVFIVMHLQSESKQGREADKSLYSLIILLKVSTPRMRGRHLDTIMEAGRLQKALGLSVVTYSSEPDWLVKTTQKKWFEQEEGVSMNISRRMRTSLWGYSFSFEKVKQDVHIPVRQRNCPANKPTRTSRPASFMILIIIPLHLGRENNTVTFSFTRQSTILPH